MWFRIVKNGRRSEVKMSGSAKNSSQPRSQQAQWNVQVVKGKVTTRCLWNACKALSIGLLLLSIGTTMAVIGYYADQLSIRSEKRGNSTVRIKNESRGFHLNNLSYAGPIVMGIGGFIVVAACVMTFEARDSAAKVVPARFKPNLNASITSDCAKATPRTSKTFHKMESKKSASVQTPGGSGKSSGVCRFESVGNEWFSSHDSVKRTAAFVQLSREFMESSNNESNRRRKRIISAEAKLKKSPSAPNLVIENVKANVRRQCKGLSRTSTKNHRESAYPLETSNLLLRPTHLQRQALSMDNPFFDACEFCTSPGMNLTRQQSRKSGGSKDSFEMELGSSAGVTGSQASMALDLHDCQVTLRVKDESANKRSDTARRHQLLRQKPIEDDIIPRCFCIPRFLCAPAMEDCSGRTESSVNLKSSVHHRIRASGKCSDRSPLKMSPASRSHSFSPTCLRDRNRCPHLEDSLKIFCIDNHKGRNLSSENIRHCCDIRRSSPGTSPHRSIQTECRARIKGSECLVHSGGSIERDQGHFSRNNLSREESSSNERQRSSSVVSNEPEAPS